MRGEPKVNFFAQKLPDLAPVLKQTDKTQACHRRAWSLNI